MFKHWLLITVKVVLNLCLLQLKVANSVALREGPFENTFIIISCAQHLVAPVRTSCYALS